MADSTEIPLYSMDKQSKNRYILLSGTCLMGEVVWVVWVNELEVDWIVSTAQGYIVTIRD